MNTFDIPGEWLLSNITLYQIDLLSTEMKEKEIKNINRLISVNGTSRKLSYADAPQEEGFLNIPVGRCQDDRCFVHLFGKMNGKELKSVSSIGAYSSEEFCIVKERIKYILTNSRQCLKRYYSDSDINSIKEHLTAFLFVS